MSQKIIDVSEHNGKINWQRVKDAGYHAIIRLGYGQESPKQRDKYAVNNVQECERLGIPYGLYIYSYADTKQKAYGEANHAINFILNFCGKNFKYPCFYDVEEARISRIARENSLIFCRELVKAGYKAGVYANENWWLTILRDDFDIAYYRWVAKWSKNKPDVSGVSLWQYTDRDKIPGITGNVDCSFSYFDIKETSESNQYVSVDQLADKVEAGEFGNGEDRKKALGNKYDVVQLIVNLRKGSKAGLNKVVNQVINGDYGNGETRKINLGEAWSIVQREVNKKLK